MYSITLESLIKKTIEATALPEATVEKIIGFKWKFIHESLSKSKGIEDSGLAKFKIRPHKVLKKLKEYESIRGGYLKRLNEEEISEKCKDTLLRKLQSVESDIEYLNTKL